MAFKDEVITGVNDVVDTAWSIREGRVVPATDGVTLKNGAVKLKATYLYADLANSSGAAQTFYRTVTAKIVRAYLNAATRIIRHYGGEIRSFDGDRVMGIFVGTHPNNQAVKAAFGINWALHKVISPKLNKKWPDLHKNWKANHGIGIANGEALIVRGGVRDDSDLVSIGSAPNVAAKLSELRGSPYTYIAKSVYNALLAPQLKSGDAPMWQTWPSQVVGGKTFAVMASTWWRVPS